MRRLATVVSTFAFALSGLAISPANTAEISQVLPSASTPRFTASDPEIATPATFDPGIQNAIPSDYFNSVSCPSSGNCVAVGSFQNADGFREAFVQTLTNGSWSNGIPATFGPGIQNTSPSAYFVSVSCASVGNCAAVGTFENANGYYEAFTQTQTSGQWDTALPATFGGGIQNANPDSSFASVSCPSVGNCIAAGRLKNSSGFYQAFTQTQTNGVWDTATPVTFGVGIQSMYPDSSFSSISCPSVGECVAVGKFKNTNYDDEAFMQTQSNGVWGTAIPAAFSDGIQNVRPQSRFNSVSCASVGNCVAVGGFSNTADAYEAFTQTLVNGAWANARPAIFGAGIQNASPGAGLDIVSCLSPGNCIAAGQFRNINGDNEAFTQTQTNGQWGNAVPARFANGIQSATPNSLFWAVSCASVGNCVAAGQYTNPNGDNEAFTQNQINGQWATAIPATFAVGVQNQNPASYFGSFSCAPDGSCVGVGEFANASGYYEAFSQKITLTLEPPAVAPVTKATNVTKVVGFATNSSALTAAQKLVLKALVAKSGKKAAFVITGTAGKLPGLSDKKVKALAIKRGEIVKAYLVKLGVNKFRITVRAQITNQGIAPKTKVLARYLESK